MINAFSKSKISFHLPAKRRFDMKPGEGVLLFFLLEERVSLGSFKTGLLKFPGLPLPAWDK